MAARKRSLVTTDKLTGEEAKAILKEVHEAVWLREEFVKQGERFVNKPVWVPDSEDRSNDMILSIIVSVLEKAGMKPVRRLRG